MIYSCRGRETGELLQFVNGIMGLQYDEFCKEIMKRKCWILDWMERIEDANPFAFIGFYLLI